MKKINEYLTITKAAEYLGVTAATLRNWDRTKKLRSNLHPLTGHRLYNKDDLDQILKQLEDANNNI